jgi:HSP20 family protein
MNIFSKFTSNGRSDSFDYDEELVERKQVSVKQSKSNDEDEVGELSVDVYETNKEIIIEAMIAGVKPEDLQITTTHESINISGRREANGNIKEDQYLIQELYWGVFSRNIELPADIAVDEAEALEKHGLLIIRLPKIDKDRNIKVKVKSLS